MLVTTLRTRLEKTSLSARNKIGPHVLLRPATPYTLRKATPINSQQSIQKKLHSVFGTRKRTAHQHAHAIHHIHIHLHGLKLVHEFPPVMVSYHSV